MINSMTGFGAALGELDGISCAVEIKSVNNRYFKSKVRLPDLVAFMEEDIEQLLRKNLSRGMIDYTIKIKDASADTLFEIDEKALKVYVEKLDKIASSVGRDCPIDMGSLLSLPGIVQAVVPEKDEAVRIAKQVLAVSQEAIDKLKQMRATEGAALSVEMEGYCESMRVSLEQIRDRSSLTGQEYLKKLRKRVDDLLSGAGLKLDDETLSREVAVYADKCDISEEIVRLGTHLDQFRESCLGDGNIGRRLDFLSQEMLREANTIASKASNTEIIHWVVDIKCWIDRIKEQVQNVE